MKGSEEVPDSYDSQEVSTYWRRIHNLAAQDFAEKDDELLPVVADPGTPDWEKQYIARFQRRAVLRTLRHAPDLAGHRGLEFGCGTGRWIRLLTELGARMVGIDISEDVIERNQRIIPQAEFRCIDITKKKPEKESYDFVLSVTVIQHLPYQVQDEVVRVLSESLKPAGTFLMLENIHDKARTVFARSIDGWKGLARDSGLDCVYSRGYGFDLLPRLGHRLLNLGGFPAKAKKGVSGLSPEDLAAATYARYSNASQHRRYGYVFRPLVSMSHLAEPISQLLLPSGLATHCAFVFRKV